MIKIFDSLDLQEGIGYAMDILNRQETWPLSIDPRFLFVLKKAMRQTPFLLVEFDGNKPKSFLSLALTKSRIFGSSLTSLPYLNYGGVIGGDLDSQSRMIETARQLAKAHKADQLLLRNFPSPHRPSVDPSAAVKLNALLSLSESVDGQWQDLKSKVRNKIRQAQKHELTCSNEGEHGLEAFYQVFARNMRDLGTPVYPKALFEYALKHFGERVGFYVVRNLEDKPLAASFVLHGKGVSEVPSASCLREFNSLQANMLLYWTMLESCIQRGQTSFDFGRCTPNSGTHSFKKSWGAELTPAPWQHFPLTPGAAVAKKEDKRNQVLIRAWQHLPVAVTKALGPSIVRGLP